MAGELVDSGRSSPLTSVTLALAQEMAYVNEGGFDDVMKHVIAAVSLLQQNFNEEELLNGLEVLQSHLKKENVDIIRYLELSKIHQHVLTVLHHLPQSLELQQVGFSVLLKLCEVSSQLRNRIFAADIHKFLLEQLNFYDTDTALQKSGMEILAYMLSSATYRDNLILNGQDEAVASAICQAIRSFPDKRGVQCAACRAINNFLIDNENVELRTFFIENVCDSVVDALKEETESETQIQVLHSLFGTQESDIATLVQKDVHLTLMELCAKYPSNESLMAETTEMLALMSTDENVRTIMSANNFVQNGLFAVMEGLKLSENVQRSGLKMLELLMPSSLQDESKADEISQMVVKCIYTAMFTQIEHTSVQVASCRALSVLLEQRPEASKFIGEITEEQQYPVHNLCLGALFTYPRDPEIFVAVCEAIFWLAADNERVCTALMGKNVHEVIIGGLRRHRQRPQAVETGCRALRGLCIFLPKHKEAVVESEAFDLLIDFQQRYKNDVTVQIEVISAIACLADVDVVRHQCFVEKVHERIIETMYQFSEELIIQEVGLEAFAVLAGAEGGPDLLLNTRTLYIVLETMEMFPENFLITKKGLIVLQLLASPVLLTDSETRNKIVVLLKSALLHFPQDKGIQSEACVAIQLFAEADATMSRAFVDVNCHECLFKVLENDAATSVQELASECLFVLSQEQNQKSIMLLSACRNGMLPATECLIELGADVNIGDGTKTPLYLAVDNQHEDIVRLLLRQEIQDLRTPLARSLVQGSHVITGLLLQQLGLDRDGGLICWSGLELDNLDRTWILTALRHELQTQLDSEIGRVYIDKIKNSAERRKKRKLEYSKSDSFVRPIIRMRHNTCERHQHHTQSIEQEDSRILRRESSIITRTPRQSDADDRFLNSDAWRLGPRSKSVDVRVMPSPRSSKKPNLPTIIASSPATTLFDSGESYGPVFDQSPTEEGEWKELTLSGANVSYSSNDPRIHQTTNLRRNSSGSDIDPHWKRKRIRTPRGSTSSDEGSPLMQSRKMSEPSLANLDKLFKGRKLSRRASVDSFPSIVIYNRSSSWADTTAALAHEFRRITIFDVSENLLPSVTALECTDLTICLSKVHTLDLRNNKITKLPELLYMNVPCLKVLDASDNILEDFPDSLLQCQHLEELRLASNKIKQVTMKHFNTSLKKLDLSHNQIKELPEGIGNYYHNIRELCLSHNDLMALPETQLGLHQLQTLNLSNNQIDCLPDEFLLSCGALETLDLSFNILSHLPDESYAAKLPMLAKLKVRRNFLATKAPFFIPRFILELPSLRTIDISENQITGFPPLPSWKTQTMKDFIASRNLITQLDLQNARLWSKLERLHVAHNMLTELPREIGQFSSLTSLDISHNKIKTLPDELGKCSRIYEMPVDGLDLDINRVVMRRRVKDIISYLHNRLKNAQRYYRMKLMVVGYGGRGKTTLLRTLMKGKPKKKENGPTVGVVVKDWVYSYTRLERRPSDDSTSLFKWGRRVQFTLSTWDFAGQEEFYSTHNCYLSNRAIYLVVFDIRRGLQECENLKSWLVSIRSRAPGCPVIIVGTHNDKLKDGNKEILQVTDMLREFNIKPGFPNISHVFLVDATKENESMESLRNAIKKIVDTCEIHGKRVMGEKIPASYVQLADLLSERARADGRYPVINHRELSELVQKNQLELDDDELQQAVRFLHECGVLLHYDDSSLKLKDYYFIDPGWLCRMMAQVITVRQINPFISHNGILRKKDIHILFKGNSMFPMELIPQYIKLLEKFEIALPHSDTELLIPCRLPEQKPNINPPGAAKITRIYRMPYVPMGLWFRLIARVISMTTQAGFKSLLKLGKPQKTVCWRKGVYVYWSENEYFLLDSSKDEVEQTDSILIIVPLTSHGSRLLGQIVDSVDNLIDEWYPGLTCIDPLMGQEVLEVLAPCTQCSDISNLRGRTEVFASFTQCPGEAHLFSVSELRSIASHQDTVVCPQHKADVLLRELAPDLVLGDVEFELQLDVRELQLVECSEKRLGDGGFGDVYRATYKNKEVAAKVFKEVADVHALTMLRQEATILRCLKHPSVVCMVAVGIRPPVILIELAPHGTLGNLFKHGREFNKRALQHRIAQQVAEGLMYLHSIMIIFRDMKPENVLIFNTSLEATINAKISDYGISRVATLQGLRAQEGTPAFRAPEVIRKENYSFKADIFSYGITMYIMLTGRHPFDYMDSRGEMDRAIAEGLTIPQPESKTSSLVWPDMKHVTMSCLSYEPEDRPDSQLLYETLRRSEVLCLQRVIPVSRSTTVECLCVESIPFGGKKDLRLWIASGDSETFQLSHRLVSDPTRETKGMLFNHGRILCMESLGDNRLALGTQDWKVWIFDTSRGRLLHSSATLEDSVLCMNHFKRNDKDESVLLAGLANGKVAIFSLSELLNDADVTPICLYPGNDYESVVCMKRLGRRIFHSCGTQIVVINTSKYIEIEKIIQTDESRDASSPPIYNLAVIKGQIIFTKKSSATVEIWDVMKEKVNSLFKVDEMFGISRAEARVTALSVDNTSLWIGTHCGIIGIVDLKTLNVLALTHRHVRAVRSLVHVKDKGSSRNRIVFSGGLGFREITRASAQQEDMCGCVLVWDADFPQHAKSNMEYERNRRALQTLEIRQEKEIAQDIYRRMSVRQPEVSQWQE